MAVYDKGDLVRCSASFTDAAGTAFDPANVFFALREPTGAKVTFQYGVDAELVRDSTGVYHIDINASAPGHWWYRFYSTGSGQAAGEGVFVVRRSMLD